MLRPDQVEHFPDVVYAAHSPSDFVLLCSRALEETGSWARDRRREYGKAAAWSQRAEDVNRILESIGLF
jgi:GTP cyclohydrolase III